MYLPSPKPLHKIPEVREFVLGQQSILASSVKMCKLLAFRVMRFLLPPIFGRQLKKEKQKKNLLFANRGNLGTVISKLLIYFLKSEEYRFFKVKKAYL
jgi:hypothetical protein